MNDIPDPIAEMLGIVDPDKRAMQIRDLDNRLLEFTESLTDEQIKVLLNVVGKAGLVRNDEFLAGIGQFTGLLMSEKYRRNRASDFAQLGASPNA